MPIIEIEITNQKIRNISYYLGKRYNKKRGKKGLERLIKDAINQVIGEEAQKELQELSEGS